MKLRHAAALALILAVGCAGQNSTSKPASDFGCKINPIQMCQTAITEHKLTGVNEEDVLDTPSKLQQLNPNATTVMAGSWLKMPTGEIAYWVTCEMNPKHYSLVYARLVAGPKSQRAADFLQAQGLCSDSN
jgi:hypothetical protein